MYTYNFIVVEASPVQWCGVTIGTTGARSSVRLRGGVFVSGGT